jgi:hypothetical protein
MSEEQVQEIHNQFIKGLTWRVLGVGGMVLIPMIYQSSVFINEQHIQGVKLEKINTQMDTVQQRQSRYEFNQAIKMQRIDDKLQELSEKK